jgi:hypothetical protein
MSRSKLPQGWYAKYATLKPIPSPAPVPAPGRTPEAGAGSAEALEGEAPPMLRITIRFEPGGEKWQKRLRWLLKHAKRAFGIDFVEIAPFPTHRLPKEATSGKETRTPTKDQTPPATEAAQPGGRVDP